MHPMRRGFTLTELLVVIALIALLAGLLLASMGPVMNARRGAETTGTMQSFIGACQAFKAEHGFFPGVVPERILAFHNHNVAHDYPAAAISSTENALLHLLGGYALRDDMTETEWQDLGQGWVQFTILRPGPENPPILMKVNKSLIGTGPVINGKSYKPYLDVDSISVRVADADFVQWRSLDEEPNTWLPDLVDAWGTPILYVRRARDHGPLGGDAHGEVKGFDGIKPRYMVDSLWPYTRAPTQMWKAPGDGGGDGSGSLLSTYDPSDYADGGFDSYLTHRGLAQIVRHGGVGRAVDDPLDAEAAVGDIVLISAGPDRIYYSAVDGPGSTATPIGTNDLRYQDFLELGPSVIDEFDDLRQSG